MSTATTEPETTTDKPERRLSGLMKWEQQQSGTDSQSMNARAEYRRAILAEEVPSDAVLEALGYVVGDAERDAARYAHRKSAAAQMPELKEEIEQMEAEKKRLRSVDPRERLVETCQTIGELFDALNDVQYPAPPIGGEVHRLSEAKAHKRNELTQYQRVLMETVDPAVMAEQAAAETSLRRAAERVESLRSEINERRQDEIRGHLVLKQANSLR